MFKYEDMDFQSLTTSLDIENPDGPEELYALAQFCRMGKGIQASEENYRLYLQRAADAGSEQARQELNAQSSADTAAAAETPADATAVADMSLPELMQAADNGNPYALLPLAKKAMSREFHDLPKAKQWLEKAAALAPQGVYSDEDATKIYITLGRLLKKPEFDTPENRAACHRYYSLAAELGSGEACDELANQYEKGYGCTADPEKAKLYAARGDNRNDPAIMIFSGISKIKSGQNLMDLVADISRIRKASDDSDILAYADLLAAAAGFESLKPEIAKWAWDHEHNGDINIAIHTNAHFNGIPGDAQNLTITFHETKQMLAMAYDTDPEQAIQRGLPVDAHKAGLLASWMPNAKNSVAWAKYGAAENDPCALYRLAFCNEQGIGTEKNPTKAFELCMQSAQRGYVDAQTKIAEFYNNGIGTKKNTEQFLLWAEKAAAGGSADAMFNLGCYYHESGNFQCAIDWFIKAGNAGKAVAYSNLASMYQSGKGTQKDLNKARELNEKAASMGDASAYFALGSYYDHGIGVAVNKATAIAYYKKASDKNFPLAWYRLAGMYEKGDGVPKDCAMAAEIYQKGVASNDTNSIQYLGDLYLNGGENFPKNVSMAFEMYSRAEALGAVDYAGLGTCYMKGYGVQKDYDRAMAYILKGYESGEDAKWAADNLIVLAQNIKVNQDNYDFFRLYSKAAELGSAEAMVELAHLYETGSGVAQDMEKAKEYYRQAAAQGNDEALNKMLHGSSTPGAAVSYAPEEDPLMQRAKEILGADIDTTDREKIKLQLSLQTDNAAAAALLQEFKKQDNLHEDLGKNLAGSMLLWVVGYILAGAIRAVPVVGGILALVCSLAASVGFIMAAYHAYKMHFVYHLSFADPDIRRGYYKAPQAVLDWCKALTAKKK